MASQTNNNDTLLNIKLEELGIRMMLNQYHDIQEDYIRNKNGGFNSQAKIDLDKMNEINYRLLNAMNKATTLLNNSYKKGIYNQQQVEMNNPQLVNIANKLKNDEKRIKKEYDEFMNIHNDGISTALSRRSSLFQYIVMSLLAIIIVGVTIITISNKETNTTETIILILGIGLLLYHSIEKIYESVI